MASAEEVYNGITSGGGGGGDKLGCLPTLIAIVVFAAILFAFKEFGAYSVFKVVGTFFTIMTLIGTFILIVVGIMEVFND